MNAQFLYPTSRQYPIDAVCEEIVRALEARNFDVPGIAVDFYTYGSGEQHVRHLSTATGENFSLHFGRPQGTLPGDTWNDCAAVSTVTVGDKKLSIYQAGAGPRFWLYVGDDPVSRRKFLASSWPGVNSKLNGEPRTYLTYRGNYANEQGYARQGSMLLHNDDFGREYDPIDEPSVFVTSGIMRLFESYLREVVLAQISKQPEVERVELWPAPVAVPWPPDFGKLYCFATWEDVDRIHQGQQDKQQLPAPKRYGMSGNGWRLLSLGVPNDGTVPEIAYEGFLWCGTEEPGPPHGLRVPGCYRGWRDDYMLCIRPNRANDIYIADHSDDRLARARSIVPICEYRGGFSQPVVLVRRELGFDEVEVVA